MLVFIFHKTIGDRWKPCIWVMCKKNFSKNSWDDLVLMVKFAHSNLSNFEKNIVFHHFWGKREEKIVCDCLRNQKGFPLFPNTNKHIYQLCWSLSFLFGGVLWRGKATFFFPFCSYHMGKNVGKAILFLT